MSTFEIELTKIGETVCHVRINGPLSLENATSALRTTWQHDDFLSSDCVIWNLLECPALPDFNVLISLSNLSRKERPADGPQYVAFVASSLAGPLAQTLSGFSKRLALNVRFFGTLTNAIKWFREESVSAQP